MSSEGDKMAYRNLMLTTPVKISCQKGQLVVRGENEYTFPIEDLAAIVLESSQSTITAAALSALTQNGTVLFVCDQKHLPCGIAMPFAQHSRQLEISKEQLAWTVVAKKRLWQQIVKAKICNQAECLHMSQKEADAIYPRKRAAAVTSGDKDNVEATAAAFYFSALFGSGFTRGDESDFRNAALNYGYAILRGCMARCLCVYGFIPWVGLHHSSALNQFNLSDDMMEPYRPIVDLFVATFMDENEKLNTQWKAQLFNLLNADILLNQKRYSVAYAMELQVQSLRRQQLLLPELLPLSQHTYE